MHSMNGNQQPQIQLEMDMVDPVEKEKESFVVCGIDFGSIPSFWAQIVICTFFLILCYSIYGVITEYIFSIFPHSSFLTFSHHLVYCSLSLVLLYRSRIGIKEDLKTRVKEMFVVKDSESGQFSPRVLYLYIGVAFCRSFGRFFTYESLMYINYSTKILFKNGRIIVTMIVGTIWMRRRYGVLDYITSFVLVLGLYFIHTANTESSVEFSPIGYIFMVLSILPDSFGAQLQEKLLKDEKQPIARLVFYADFFGILVAIVLSIAKREFFSSILILIFEHPKLIFVIILQVTAGFCGYQFLLMITKLHGVLITQTATSVRKVFSVFLSFAIFPKAFHLYHMVGIVFVFVGVFLRVLEKYRKLLMKKDTDVI